MRGPLDGVRVLEFAGIGPAPFCAMLLADLGAEVVRVERAGDEPYFRRADPVTTRGRSTLALDLKAPDALDLALAALEHADVLVEGFRPGVMERLGLGPDVALRRNPRLIYGRMTGWGRSGPLAQAAARIAGPSKFSRKQRAGSASASSTLTKPAVLITAQGCKR